MKKIKHFGSYLKLIISRIYWTLRDKRFWMVLALIITFYMWGWLNANYFFQSPVKEWRCWMCSRSIKNTQKTAIPATLSAKLIQPTPEPTLIPLSEEEIVKGQPHGAILWRIYQKETQRGKTDYCRLNGKGHGGFGVMDNKHNIVCYDTFQQAADRAEYWLALLNPDKDLVNALCTWEGGPAKTSEGKPTTYQNCSYYQDYLEL